MSKLSIALASLTLAGAVTIAAVEYARAVPLPDAHIRCYYSGTFCSYPGTAYWSQCNPNYLYGFIRSDIASDICRTFHMGTVW